MNKQKSILLLIIFFLSLAKSEAQTATTNIGDVLTLKQAVDIAIKNNLVVEQS